MLTNRFLFTAVFAGLLLIPQINIAEDEAYYMWTDENGVANFSQMIPKDQDVTLIEKIQLFGPKPIPPSRLDSRTSSDARENARIHELNCMIGKKSLEKLQSFKNIFLRGSDGWWKAITADQRREKIRDTKKIIADHCEESDFFEQLSSVTNN